MVSSTEVCLEFSFLTIFCWYKPLKFGIYIYIPMENTWIEHDGVKFQNQKCNLYFSIKQRK